MEVTPSPSRKLAVILHADVAGSTTLVQRNEVVAHERMQDVFRRFSVTIESYGGIAHEFRGNALVAEFARASDAVTAALSFQSENSAHNNAFTDDIRPEVRAGISLGEVVIADGTITGTGVVLAQRLAQLAEAGAVVVQGSVAETVPTRMPFDFEDLGTRELKGFDQLTRAFAVSVKSGEQVPEPEPMAASNEYSAPTDEQSERPALELPDKPSIAFLPFDDLSGDQEQEYFADGMAEDIITGLSRFRSLFVVARNSSFTYKGRSIDVRQVGAELGVRYVLEGSVRRAGQKVRVTAQLIDAPTGNHIWADRYDRRFEDIFALQDEMTRAIFANIAPAISAAEIEHHAKVRGDDTQAYDLEIIFRDDSSREESLRSARENAERVLSIDPIEPAGAYCLGIVKYYSGQYDDGLADLERACELNPNDAVALASMSWIKAMGGLTADAEAHAAEAIRLCPRDNRVVAMSQFARCLIAFLEHGYQSAVDWARQAIQRQPSAPMRYTTLAASLLRLGKPEEAQEAISRLRERRPRFLETLLRGEYRVFRDVAGNERYIKAVREVAEIPEPSNG